MRQVEAVLFSAGRKIEVEEITGIVGVGQSAVKDALKTLKKEYEKNESPMMILEEESAWKMTVREKYLPLVRKITPYMEFSKTLMETLAVVAWKQPILQADVIKIRTNKAYEHIMELEKMGFLAKEKHGRSFLLKLSQKFYDYFDLRDDIDVRNLFKNIKDDIPQKKMTEFDKPAGEAGGEMPEQDPEDNEPENPEQPKAQEDQQAENPETSESEPTEPNAQNPEPKTQDSEPPLDKPPQDI